MTKKSKKRRGCFGHWIKIKMIFSIKLFNFLLQTIMITAPSSAEPSCLIRASSSSPPPFWRPLCGTQSVVAPHTLRPNLQSVACQIRRRLGRLGSQSATLRRASSPCARNRTPEVAAAAEAAVWRPRAVLSVLDSSKGKRRKNSMIACLPIWPPSPPDTSSRATTSRTLLTLLCCARKPFPQTISRPWTMRRRILQTSYPKGEERNLLVQ